VCVDPVTYYLLTLQVETSGSPDLGTSGLHTSCILRETIYPANGVSVTIQQHNNPDTVVLPEAKCMVKCKVNAMDLL
jgi:hypothetical protein